MMLCTGILRFVVSVVCQKHPKKHLPPHQRSDGDGSGKSVQPHLRMRCKASVWTFKDDFCYCIEGKMKQQVTSIEKPCSMMIHEYIYIYCMCICICVCVSDTVIMFFICSILPPCHPYSSSRHREAFGQPIPWFHCPQAGGWGNL